MTSLLPQSAMISDRTGLGGMRPNLVVVTFPEALERQGRGRARSEQQASGEPTRALMPAATE